MHSGFRIVALLLFAGIVLAPLRAVAATIPMLFAYDYDEALRPIATSFIPFRLMQGATFDTHFLDRTTIHDINGDGLADVIVERDDSEPLPFEVPGIDVYINRDGRSFEAPVRVHHPRDHDHREIADTALLFADMNGSGTDDLVVLTGDNVYVLDWLDAESRPGSLVEIVSSAGARTTFGVESLAALGQKRGWSDRVPLSPAVVTSVLVEPSPGAVGPASEGQLTTFEYENPVLDAWERRFLGFKKVTATTHGDPRAPTSSVETTFEFAECLDVWGGCHRGALPSWRDERRLSAGRPSLREVRSAGITLSTTHWTYRTGKLPEVGSIFTVAEQTDTFLYDTSPFQPGGHSITLDARRPRSDAAPEREEVALRSDRYDHVRATHEVDDFGNTWRTVDVGRVLDDGSPVDSPIVTVRSPVQRVPERWIWRTESVEIAPFAKVQGVPEGHRRFTRFETNEFGQLTDVFGVLEGTLPLDRSHVDPAKGTAPAPRPAPSGEVRLLHLAPDPWGNPVLVMTPDGRCTTADYEPLYRQFAVADHAFPAVCGENPLTTTVEFDRGLAKPTRTVGPDGTESAIVYTGFGEVSEVFDPDPVTGVTPSMPSAYFVYKPWPGAREVRAFTREAAGGVRETRSYVNGLGRTLEVFTHAGGDRWIGSGLVEVVKGLPVVAYAPMAIEGDPGEHAFGFHGRGTLGRATYDGFGRVIDSFARDGTRIAHVAYHGLATEAHDGESLKPKGAHANTPMWTQRDGHGQVIATKKRVRLPVADELIMEVDRLATGEIARVVSRHSASADRVERWMMFDSLGRLVLNAEPNTSTNFAPPELASLDVGNPKRLRAWRYAYNGSGDVVGTSDARGCGKNIVFDGLGRPVAEDYSPCLKSHVDYTPLVGGVGAEVSFGYDGAGRLESVLDRGAATSFETDRLGRPVGITRRISRPAPETGYAEHVFRASTRYDAAGRVAGQSLGVDVAELQGADGASAVRFHYGPRGLLESIDGSYGSLITHIERDVEGDATSIGYGDRLQTVARVGFDARKRTELLALERAAPASGGPLGSLPTLLDARRLTFDDANNVLQVEDLRDADDWPVGAKPVTRHATVDDQYRVTSVEYHSASPDASRVKSQRFAFDWKGNLADSSDDASMFYERSLGLAEHDPQAPHRLVRAKGPAGVLGVQYDEAGNMSDVVVERAASQRFHYDWDEVGQLVRAQRWDSPSGGPMFDVAYAYDASGNRVRRSVTDTGGNTLHSVEVFRTLRLDGAAFEGDNYQRDATTESASLGGLARVVVVPDDVAARVSGKRRVLFSGVDHLGSTSSVFDQQSSEVLEHTTYMPFGGIESEYRPERWGSYRDPVHFTGKEDDRELGLVYFGARYLHPGLSRWISPDPLTIHGLGADLNPYAYVGGQVLSAVDPWGLSQDTAWHIDLGSPLPWHQWVQNPAPGQAGDNYEADVGYDAYASERWGTVQYWDVDPGSYQAALARQESAANVTGMAASGALPALAVGVSMLRGDSVEQTERMGAAAMLVAAAGAMAGPMRAMLPRRVPELDRTFTPSVSGFRVSTGVRGLGPGVGSGGVVAGEAGSFGALAARRVVGDALTPHHMPQAGLGFTLRAEGGALVLPEAEHALTRTFAGRGIATARQEAGMVFRDVLARDIRDVRQLAGPKYDAGLRQLLDYYYATFPGLMAR